jgi:2-oxoglutarate/2-oxoacid ferredoxin oxidoreductase subunit alpha
MNDVSVLIGGKAGDGINSAGAMVAQLLGHMGYHIYLYFDYPSLIRGGHNFAVIRGAETGIGTCREKVDFLLALNQETVQRHRDQLNPGAAIIFNADLVKGDGQGVPVTSILHEEQAPAIMGNSALIGGFAKAAGIPWETVEAVFRAHIPKGIDQNLKVARRAYDQLATVRPIKPCNSPGLPLLSGNEAIGLGLAMGGLEAYVSYPMTPSSSLLHFLAEEKEKLGITVVHPENEIAVMLMALGFAYAGKRTAVGTSGGGFCLMTEGLSLAAMAELPVVIVMSQRTGPSTGLPTYSGQSELQFVLHAGQGEFPRLIVAPGDAEEALYWSAVAMNVAWKFQIPAFILPDKTLSEGTYSVAMEHLPAVHREDPAVAGQDSLYKRYAVTSSGISPLAFPGAKGGVVKVNSYAHDESGYTTEEAEMVSRMTGKRMRKWEGLMTGMEEYPPVNSSGPLGATIALLSWGSTKGVCREVAGALGLRVVQPVVLSPFPMAAMNAALDGVTTVICVEENATAQLATLAERHGIAISKKVLRYDGRPFTYESLLARVQEALS